MEDTPPVAPKSSVTASRCTGSDRPSPVTPRCAAPRRANVAARRSRRIHAADHVRGRPAGSARPTGAGGGPGCRSERRPCARLPGPSASTRGTEPVATGGATDRARLSTLGRTASRPRRRRRTRSQQERRRREYESLFASNVVLSRRPESQRPDAGRSETSMQSGMPTAGGTPTVDEIADAALRATTRAAGLNRVEAQASPGAAVQQPRGAGAGPTTPEQSRTPERTGPISAAGPLHRILEGTLVDAVLTNRLDGTHRGARELPGHEPAVLAQRAARR